MNILVTGGLGYIGSHTVVELIMQGENVIIVDNLINSNINVLEKIENITGIRPVFYEYDVSDKKLMNELFIHKKFDGVIHFAGLKSVGESVEKPLYYYSNNVISTINMCELCLEYNVDNFIFSSSATVYGRQDSPLKESFELKRTTNPYGETKAISERIIEDVVKVNPSFNATLLRYFNPVGAHKSGLIGENPVGVPNNLMPYITKVAKGELKNLSIFGNDYDTQDGTGIRDYIHVVDLAKAHVIALNNIKEGINIYNVGTGKGTSVLELLNTFIKVNNVEVPYKFVERRRGDLAICYADVSKIHQELGWEAQLDIVDMVRDSWNYTKYN